MRLKIYQIDPERDADRVKFMSMDFLDRHGLVVDPDKYTEVFNAEIENMDEEEIFEKFNTEMHPLYRGHSLSVSDVIVNEDGAFFCDNFDFEKIDFDESLTHKPDNLMQVVFVEPHKAPYIAEIENTLEAEQKAVGGYIEAVYNDDGTCLIGNEEAKLIGLEGNRYLDDGHSIIAGAFFVCGTTEEDFCGLNDYEADKYMKRFAEPEDISQEEVQADTGFRVFFM